MGALHHTEGKVLLLGSPWKEAIVILEVDKVFFSVSVCHQITILMSHLSFSHLNVQITFGNI